MQPRSLQDAAYISSRTAGADALSSPNGLQFVVEALLSKSAPEMAIVHRHFLRDKSTDAARPLLRHTSYVLRSVHLRLFLRTRRHSSRADLS